MTATQLPAAGEAPGPAAPTRRRRALAWVAFAAVLTVVGTAGFLLSGLGERTQLGALDPDSPAPAGTRALAAVLREQGVEVVVARDRDAARTALDAADGDATLALPDAPALSDAALRTLGDGATDIVLLDPATRSLDLFLPGAAGAGFGGGAAVQPGCALPEAERAGPVAPGGLFAPGGDASVVACYPSDDGFGLLVRGTGAGRIVAVDGATLFANDALAADGSAALALNLLGRHGTVVWYVPSFGDSDLADASPSLADLTPGWVTPAIVLLALSGIVAAVWRGRRFGPLVAERLPVTVRVSETTEGRARLYARSRDTLHAADQLRLGSLDRMSRMLSLGGSADVGDIVDAVADRVRADRGVVRGILVDDLPATDAQLVELSDRLHALETAVQAAVRPGRNRP